MGYQTALEMAEAAEDKAVCCVLRMAPTSEAKVEALKALLDVASLNDQGGFVGILDYLFEAIIDVESWPLFDFSVPANERQLLDDSASGQRAYRRAWRRAATACGEEAIAIYNQNMRAARKELAAVRNRLFLEILCAWEVTGANKFFDFFLDLPSLDWERRDRAFRDNNLPSVRLVSGIMRLGRGGENWKGEDVSRILFHGLVRRWNLADMAKVSRDGMIPIPRGWRSR